MFGKLTKFHIRLKKLRMEKTGRRISKQISTAEEELASKLQMVEAEILPLRWGFFCLWSSVTLVTGSYRMHCRLWSIKSWKSLLSIQGKLLTLKLSHHLLSPPLTTLLQMACVLLTPFYSLYKHGLQHLRPPHRKVHQAALCMVAYTCSECLCFSRTSLPRWIFNQSKPTWSSPLLPVFKSSLLMRLDYL